MPHNIALNFESQTRDIDDLFSKIRDLINSPRKQSKLLKQLDNWNKLCSSLDLIEDTQSAINYYQANSFPEETGGKYLFVYGLYQALYLQQDALLHIAQSLDINYKISNELLKIREIRNDCVGHPSNRKSRLYGDNYIFLVQISLSKDGFNLIRHTGNRNTKSEYINTTELITLQKKEVISALIIICNNLIEEENIYKIMHHKKKMTDIIPKTTHYYISKIFEAINNPNPAYKQLGKGHIDILKGIANDFEDELKKREIWEALDHTNYIVTDIKYPIKELNKYFENDKTNKLNDQDARIFASYLLKQFDEMVAHAKEIDEDFEKEKENIKS